jgi:hypothetical protein
MTTIRSAPSFVALLALFCLLICLPGIDAISSGAPIGAVYILAGLALCGYPLFRYKISYDNYALTFQGVFSVRSIRFNEVGSFAISGSLLSPEHELRVFARGADKPALVVNLKPFSRSAIDNVCARLETAKSSSTFSPG